jgi:hypothetical protein
VRPCAKAGGADEFAVVARITKVKIAEVKVLINFSRARDEDEDRRVAFFISQL